MTQNMKKKCQNCKKEIFKTYETHSQWGRKKYCCISCYRAVPRSAETRLKISNSCKEKGIGRWMLNRPRPIKLRLKQSIAIKKIVASGKHNFWKGGITRENKLLRNVLEYRLWREAVFERDDWTCQHCMKRGGDLEAHHIKSFAKFPELRTSIQNGITLCQLCHSKIDNFRAKPKIYGNIK